MSGGSFDYLFARVRPLEEQRGVVELMADELGELEGGEAAAAATRRVLALIDEANRLADSLVEAWHAVEWWRSGDWGYEGMIEDVQKYREPMPAEILVSTEVLSEADYAELKRRFLEAQSRPDPCAVPDHPDAQRISVPRLRLPGDDRGDDVDPDATH